MGSRKTVHRYLVMGRWEVGTGSGGRTRKCEKKDAVMTGELTITDLTLAFSVDR
uniref:Uncharacterized protein n=1 Tax=Myripristis murdjan TaxID=586833 RepID=A0A667XF41_9TELE